MEAGSWGWRVFSPSCCLSWKSLFGEATSPVLHGEGGEGGQPRLCERPNSCSHSPLQQPAVQNSYSWSSPTTECLGCTVRTGFMEGSHWGARHSATAWVFQIYWDLLLCIAKLSLELSKNYTWSVFAFSFIFVILKHFWLLWLYMRYQKLPVKIMWVFE